MAVLHGGDRSTGVLVVVGGPQYRVGSHRQFVLMARYLAEAGFPVLRFDARGMGDSDGDFPGFEHCVDDISAAIDAFHEHQPGLRRVVIWGRCDGASAALLYLHARGGDPRICGLCLVNPWVRSASTLAMARSAHYYRDRIRSKEFWRKLLTGGVSPQALQGWWNTRRLAKAQSAGRVGGASSFQARMRDALAHFQGRTLLALSGRDLTAQEFLQATEHDAAWQTALGRNTVSRMVFVNADHTFSDLQMQAELFHAMLGWLTALAPSFAAPASP